MPYVSDMTVKGPWRMFSFILWDLIIVLSYYGWSVQACCRCRTTTTSRLPYGVSLFISSLTQVIRYPPKLRPSPTK